MSDEKHDPQEAAPERPKPPGAPPGERPRIRIEQFLETELRVARVIAAEKITGADRLLKLRVDLGSEERQIVAGIARSYEPDALVGKRVVIVTNLEPARIRGVESQGMLLAADLDGRPIVATFDEEVPAGTRVR